MNSTALKSILALDVSGKCTGWCFGVPGCDRPTSGIVQWKRYDGEAEDLILRTAGNWLYHHLLGTAAELVAIEAPIKRSGGGYTNSQSQAFLLSLQGALRYVATAKTGNEVVLAPSNTVRKTFMGKGGNFDGDPKVLVQQECVRRGYIDPEDVQGDRCDAIALWTYMAAQQIPELAYGRNKSNVVPMRRAS